MKSSIFAVIILALCQASRAELVGHWSLCQGEGFLQNQAMPKLPKARIAGSYKWQTMQGRNVVWFPGRTNILAASGNGFDLSTELTLAAMIKPDIRTSETMQIICKRSPETASSYALNLRGSSLMFSAFVQGKWYTTEYPMVGGKSDKWFHVAASFKDGRVCLYIDGQPVACQDNFPKQLEKNSAPVVIGGFGGKEENFRGGIADVRIYNTILNDADILNLYTTTAQAYLDCSARTFKGERLEVKFDPTHGYAISVGTIPGHKVLLSGQYLEMPRTGPRIEGLVHNLEGTICESKRPLLMEPEFYTDTEGQHAVFWQDWPLFKVRKTVTLLSHGDVLRLRYMLVSKMDVLPDPDWPVMCAFASDNSQKMIYWEDGSGDMKSRSSSPSSEPALDGDKGRFVGWTDGAKGDGIILAKPSSCGETFNAHVFQTEEGVLATRTKCLTLNGWIKPGDVYELEWFLMPTSGEKVREDKQTLFANYHQQRMERVNHLTSITVPSVKETPVIDGQMDEAIWKKASTIGGFQTPGGVFAVQQTGVRAFVTDDTLYLGFVCYDNDLKGLKQVYTKHDDPVWNDDSIEVFVKLDDNNARYCHCLLSSNGTRMDQICDNWGEAMVSEDIKWNGAWKSATKVNSTDKQWTAEIAIPFSDLPGYTGASLKSLRVNLTRQHHVEGNSCWAPTYGPFHNIKSFGRFVFAEIGAALKIDSIGEDVGQYRSIVTVNNPSSSACNYTISLLPFDNQEQDGLEYREKIQLAAGSSTSVEIPYKNLLLTGQASRIAISLLEDGKIIANRVFKLTTVLGSSRKIGFRYSMSDQDVSAWMLTTDEKIFPSDELERPRNMTGPLEIYAARGEDESFQIALESDSKNEKETYTIVAEPLKGAKCQLPASCVRVGRIGYVRTNVVSDSYGFLQDWPDPVIPERTLTVPRGKIQGAWITVVVPHNAMPGKYNGKIAIYKDQKRVGELPYRLNVFSFELPRLLTSMYWGPDYKMFIRDQYHIDTCMDFSSTGQIVDGKVDIPVFRTKEFQDKLRLCKKINPRYIWAIDFHVGDGPTLDHLLGTTPETPEYYKRVREYVTTIYNEYKKVGLHKKLSFWVYDEPTPEHLHLIGDIARIVKSVDKDILIWAAIYVDNWQKMDERDRLSIDAWWTLYPSWSPEFTDWVKRHNKKLWAGFNAGTQYPYASLFIDHPALSPRVISWINWKYGADTIANWHTWIAPASDDPYINPANCGNFNGDGLLLYPSGPRKQEPCNVPSIRLELMREGMEDYEYFVILSRLIKECTNPEIASRAKTVLNKAESLVINPYTYCRVPETYRINRLEMAKMIEELEAFAKK